MGLFSFFRSEGHWVRSTHFFGSDTFECSVCGRQFKSASPECPRCGSRMRGTIDAWEACMRREALEEDLDEYEGIEDAEF